MLISLSSFPSLLLRDPPSSSQSNYWNPEEALDVCQKKNVLLRFVPLISCFLARLTSHFSVMAGDGFHSWSFE